MSIISLFVDIYIANIFYHTYERVVEGVLGFTILFLIFRIYIVPKQINLKRPEIITFLTSIKLVIFGVFWSIIGYWALREIIDMCKYLFKLFWNG
jgi:hypothetical protein